ncbi:MAG: hypothetical protein JWP34_1508 [Massilia sp.]|nr:hypothetical protein [Massilia sp.]
MSEIVTLSIECVGGIYLEEEYGFTLEAPVDSTLEDLASDILDVVDFDGDHFSDFFLANGLRGKKTFLTADGEPGEVDETVWNRRLSEIFPLDKHKKLFYVYDFGASWTFQITKKGKLTTARADIDYPNIAEERGSKPLEYGRDEDME